MNELTVMHAYDEFGDDGDEVKRCNGYSDDDAYSDDDGSMMMARR